MGKNFRIDGLITVPDNMTIDDFNNLFILLIESQDWYFGGTTKVYTEEDEWNDIQDIVRNA
jgi:hypothetical protein